MMKYLSLLIIVCVAVVPADSLQFNRTKNEEDIRACISCRATFAFFHSMEPKKKEDLYKPRVMEYCKGEPDIKHMCEMLTKVLFNFLADKRDFCGIAGLCPSCAEFGYNPDSSLFEDLDCDFCEFNAEQLRKAINEEEFYDSIHRHIREGLCKVLDDENDQDECIRILDENMPILVRAMKEVDIPKACQEGGCYDNADEEMFSRMQLRRMSGMKVYKTQEAIKLNVCETCSSIVSSIIDVLTDGRIGDDIKIIKEEACGSISFGPAANLCTKLITIFGETLVDAIKELDGADNVCKVFFLC